MKEEPSLERIRHLEKSRLGYLWSFERQLRYGISFHDGERAYPRELYESEKIIER
jgi:hypothetical protein